MVEQADVEQGGGPCDLLGQQAVLRTGLGGSRGVVVDEDQLGGKQLTRWRSMMRFEAVR